MDKLTMNDASFDLVVIGATPAGIVMSVRAAREGVRVLLVHHTRHLGGMPASGLGVWDTRYERRRAPLHDEIRQAFFDHYRETYGADSRQYRDALPGAFGHNNGKFEPHVAEAILSRLVRAESRITVVLEHHPVAIKREGARLTHVAFARMDGSERFTAAAKMFADCSYEADTFPLAELGYRIGRESREEHGESHAGVLFMQPTVEPPDTAAAQCAERQAQLRLRLFDGFQRRLPESTGEADGNVQAMNYRVILSADPAKRRPIECPADYDPAALQTLEFCAEIEGLPNGKMGLNRPQLLGLHVAYVEGTWAERQRVMDAHWNAALAMLWHRQNDASVPEAERNRWRSYGLATDEFADNGNRPYEIYFREGRRLVGRSLLTQADTALAPGLDRAPIHPDSIAFTEWYVDSHACTPRRLPHSLEEGKVMLYAETFPGHVPLGALLPREVDNLLVPVNLSATHVAWNAVRLEPTWMHVAESAAWVVIHALRRNQTPADVDRDELLRELACRGVMLAFFNDLESAPGNELTAAAQYYATRGFFPSYDAQLELPIKLATATLWVQAMNGAGGADPNETARQVRAADRADSPFLNSADLARLVPGHSPEGCNGGLATRGDLLRALWRHARRRGALH